MSSISDLPVAPGPWTLKAQTWWFITSFLAKPSILPLSYFDSSEIALYQECTKDGAFQGGMGTIMIVRYTEGPVGPYDELMIVPGEFKNPPGAKAKQSLRITRIYVSSLASVVNGRRNWNIPKHLAQFIWTPSMTHRGATELRVFEATSFSPIVYSTRPFFAALLKPISIPLPSIPLNLKYSPLPLDLVQPPLSASDEPSVDGVIATEGWTSIDTSGYKGKVSLVNWEGLLDDDDDETRRPVKKMADGKGFPDVTPYSVGMHWDHATIEFPAGIPVGGTTTT
ncbi:hypothetical protein JAAARDRAFT_193764 [Jaapia argillacea MUCL 33604]|uniref:Acetoacetate decarboxylase n=1 Tax=Jaapia argillacea MUCL 33604 TaxID=933084 RepID=A0A067Q1U0_9AGAM|nr:hypothetical protein JAAARDRAFT_193764 [Jaapia argillacea MUCL 33604]